MVSGPQGRTPEPQHFTSGDFSLVNFSQEILAGIVLCSNAAWHLILEDTALVPALPPPEPRPSGQAGSAGRRWARSRWSSGRDGGRGE